MALDQFLIEIEETFGVDLMAPGADEVLTLEELITYLEKFTAEMPHTQDEVDRLIQDNIDKLRTIIASSLGIDGTNISPKAELESILKPRSVRRRIWSKMRQEFSEYIPPLTSKVYRILGCAVCIPLGIFIAWSVVIGQNPENPNPMPIAVLLGTLAGTILSFSLYVVGTMVFASLFSTIPKECRTLEDTVAFATPTHLCVDRNGKEWSCESIEKTVLKIASKSSGIPVKDIAITMKFTDM